jgi:uncharacterized membrane protein YphA (DoxX/SURF4 family)
LPAVLDLRETARSVLFQQLLNFVCATSSCHAASIDGLVQPFKRASSDAYFVGVVEISFGAFILLGLLTRLSAVPLLLDISVAIATTKVPMLLDKGFWAAAHEVRTDVSMLLGLIFLLIVGAGSWSVDARLFRYLSQRK